jgi:hypothetical protein
LPRFSVFADIISCLNRGKPANLTDNSSRNFPILPELDQFNWNIKYGRQMQLTQD